MTDEDDFAELLDSSWDTLQELDSGVTLDDDFTELPPDLTDDEDTLLDSTLDEDKSSSKTGADAELLESSPHATNKTAETNNAAKRFIKALLINQGFNKANVVYCHTDSVRLSYKKRRHRRPYSINRWLGIVLEATNREPVVLTAVVQAHIVEVEEQVDVVRADAIVLRRTPEFRAVALVAVIPSVVPFASRERREPERIRAIATIPSGCGLEHLAGRRLSADCVEQSFPFGRARQVPTARAYTLDVS